MVLALVLAVTALVCAAVATPGYFAAVSAATTAHAKPPSAPAGLMVASLLGLVSWLTVVVQQWRERQFGWVVASFLLSYIGVIAYAVVRLSRSSRPTVPAGA
jgi:hypothetical protein